MLINAIDLELRVRAIARTYPDKHYHQEPEQGCHYTPDEHNPMGCIIGAACIPLDIDLWEWDLLGGIGQAYDNRIDGNTQWLSNVQYRQDRGDSWAKAVAYADDVRAQQLSPDPDLD